MKISFLLSMLFVLSFASNLTAAPLDKDIKCAPSGYRFLFGHIHGDVIKFTGYPGVYGAEKIKLHADLLSFTDGSDISFTVPNDVNSDNIIFMSREKGQNPVLTLSGWADQVNIPLDSLKVTLAESSLPGNTSMLIEYIQAEGDKTPVVIDVFTPCQKQ